MRKVMVEIACLAIALLAATPIVASTGHHARSIGGAAAICRIAQPCKHGGTIYRVTRATLTTTVTGNHGKTATAPADKAFVVVRVALYNTLLQQHDVQAGEFTVRGSDQKSYSPSRKAVDLNGYGKPQPTFFPPGFSQYMGPHHKAVVVLLFQVPRSVATGSTLEIGTTAPKAAVRLGL